MMEELKALTREALAILKEVDKRTSLHSSDLHQISENIRPMSNIDANIQRMADTLETITDRAMTALEGKWSVPIKSHLLSIAILGLMFIIGIVAATRTNFNAETSNGSKASINSRQE